VTQVRTVKFSAIKEENMEDIRASVLRGRLRMESSGFQIPWQALNNPGRDKTPRQNME
jgi:hypothetical protein